MTSILWQKQLFHKRYDFRWHLDFYHLPLGQNLLNVHNKTYVTIVLTGNLYYITRFLCVYAVVCLHLSIKLIWGIALLPSPDMAGWVQDALKASGLIPSPC